MSDNDDYYERGCCNNDNKKSNDIQCGNCGFWWRYTCLSRKWKIREAVLKKYEHNNKNWECPDCNCKESSSDIEPPIKKHRKNETDDDNDDDDMVEDDMVEKDMEIMKVMDIIMVHMVITTQQYAPFPPHPTQASIS